VVRRLDVLVLTHLLIFGVTCTDLSLGNARGGGFAIAIDSEAPQSPVVASDGQIMLAAWATEPRDFRIDEIYVAWSSDAGVTWTEAPSPPKGHRLYKFKGIPNVLQVDTGTFVIVGVLEAAAPEYLAIYRAEISGKGFVWSGEPVLIPSATGAYTLMRPAFDMPQLVAGPVSGQLHLVVTSQFATLENPDFALTRVDYLRSEDKGITWSTPVTLSDSSAHSARIAFHGNGGLYVVWHDLGNDRVVGRVSTDDGAHFSDTFLLASVHVNWGSQAPGNRTLRHYHYHPRYRCASEINGFSPIAFAIDTTEGEYRGRMYIAMTQHSLGSADAPYKNVSESELNDAPEQAQRIEIGSRVMGEATSPDFHPGEMDYYSFEGVGGQTLILDGRLTNFSPWVSGVDDICLSLPVYSSLQMASDLRDRHQLTSTQLQHASRGLSPLAVFCLPKTGTYFLHIIGSGYISKGYEFSLREWHVSSESAARDHRDILLTYSDDEGETWSAWRRVNDGTAGYGSELPQVTIDRRGSAHVAWYDRSEDPGEGLRYAVRMASSSDGGNTFTPSRKISAGSGNWPVYRILAPIGAGFFFQAQQDSIVAVHVDASDSSLALVGVSIPLLDLTGEIRSFHALSAAGQIHISWFYAGAVPLSGFEIWHRASLHFEKVGDLQFAGSAEYTLSVTDRGEGEYYLLLKPVRGTYQWTQGISVDRSLESRPLLMAVKPSPFRERAEIELTSSSLGPATVEVFDVTGRRVKVLLEESLSNYTSTIIWDGSNERGQSVASGLYYIHAKVKNLQQTVSIVRIN
jgi:hypothetical protein